MIFLSLVRRFLVAGALVPVAATVIGAQQPADSAKRIEKQLERKAISSFTVGSLCPFGKSMRRFTLAMR